MYQQTGQCLCGNVKITLLAPPTATRVCWCSDCLHTSANGSVNALVLKAYLNIDGETKSYAKTAQSGNTVTRVFCPDCGCHIYAQTPARPDHVSLRAGNMNEPAAFAPQANIWTRSAPKWAHFDEALQQFEQH